MRLLHLNIIFLTMINWMVNRCDFAPLKAAIVDYDSRKDAFTEKVQSNHAAYANLNSYSYINGDVLSLQVTQQANMKFNWAKIPLLRKCLQSFDWVLWIDGDAIFINSTSIESIISHAVFQNQGEIHQQSPRPVYPSLFFSGDTNAINTGINCIMTEMIPDFIPTYLLLQAFYYSGSQDGLCTFLTKYGKLALRWKGIPIKLEWD